MSIGDAYAQVDEKSIPMGCGFPLQYRSPRSNPHAPRERRQAKHIVVNRRKTNVDLILRTDELPDLHVEGQVISSPLRGAAVRLRVQDLHCTDLARDLYSPSVFLPVP
jgi:hypothetical protein